MSTGWREWEREGEGEGREAEGDDPAFVYIVRGRLGREYEQRGERKILL